MDIDGLSRILLRICEEFNREGVDYVVGGGFAVILHGFPRLTDDIDFFIDPSAGNVARMKKALKTLYDDKAIDDIRPEDVNNYSVVRYGTPEGFYLDIIGKVGEIADFPVIKKGSVHLEIEKVRIPVCGVKTLLKLKENTARPVDRQDAIFLKEKLSRRNRKSSASKPEKQTKKTRSTK